MGKRGRRKAEAFQWFTCCVCQLRFPAYAMMQGGLPVCDTCRAGYVEAHYPTNGNADIEKCIDLDLKPKGPPGRLF
jgi:hypothetical protein